MRRPLALAVALLGTLALAPAAAQARLPSSVETTVPPGGTSTLGSPPLSPTMRSVTVDVAPVGDEDEDLFKNMQVVLSLQPTPGKRLLTCISLYAAVSGLEDDEYAPLAFSEDLQPLAALLLSACLHMAAEVNRAAQQASAAAARCGRLATQVAARYTRVGRKYEAEIDGTPTKLRKRARLKVTCRRKGTGVTLKVRPAARDKPLRAVVGTRLRLGVYNPLEATGSGHLKVTFRR